MARSEEVGGRLQPADVATRELLFKSPDGRTYAIPNQPDKIREVVSHGWQRVGETHNAALAGGFLGSALGTPAGYPGRALGAIAGGGLGELGGELMSGQPPNMGEIQKQMAGQGAMETGGSLLAGGARLAGRGLMGAALQANPALKQQFQNMVETALSPEVRARIGRFPVFRDLLAGKLNWNSAADAVDKLRTNSAEKEWTMIRNAGQSRPPVALQAFTDAALEDAEKAIQLQEGRSLLPQERAAIFNDTRNTISDLLAQRGFGHLKPNVDELSWPQIQVLKQESQNATPGLFAARRAGTVPAGNPGLTAKVGAVAKDILHGPQGVPGLEDQAAQTQQLIGLHRAMLAREGRGVMGPAGREQQWIAGRNLTYGGLGALGALEGQSFGQTPEQRIQYGLEGLAAGMLLGKAQPLSGAALALTDPAIQALLQQGPRMLGAAVGNWPVQTSMP